MDKINKILGLYELKELNIPKIEWKEFHPDTSYFKEDQLWSIRTATFKGNDFNLPRLIGGKAKEARIFALKEYKVFKNTGLIFYYPYFIAEKSGTLLINEKEIIIEGVHKDLWNLVTDNLRDVSIVEKDNMILSYGNKDFLSDKEINEIKSYVNIIKNKFKPYLKDGQSVLLEWSFGYDTNIEEKKLNETHLIFYELKTI